MESYNTCLPVSGLFHLYHVLQGHPCCSRISFLIETELESIGCLDHIFSIRSSVGGNLGFSNTLAVVNNAATNMAVKISLCSCACNYFQHIPSSGIAGSYGNSIFLNILRNY